MDRFMERSIAGKEALVEKFRLKNGTLVASMAKLEAQLSREEGMGEALRQVDFEQLKIENQQHQETLQARNQELLRMKKTAADTAQVRGAQWMVEAGTSNGRADGRVRFGCSPAAGLATFVSNRVCAGDNPRRVCQPSNGDVHTR